MSIMNALIAFLAVFGLAFLMKESDGPFGVVNWARSALMRNKYVGVFFFKLFDCYFCVGCHCGWIVYLLSQDSYTWQFFTLWTLAGGVISLILNKFLTSR